MADEKHPRSEGWLLQENEQLRARLEEAEMTLDAIRSGEVDALVIAGPQGERIYSLTGVETVYRIITETMNEAALTVDGQGVIHFCNKRFYDLMGTGDAKILGHRATELVDEAQRRTMELLLASARSAPVQRRLTLRASDGRSVPVLLSAGPIPMGTQAAAPSAPDVCIVATDLTEIESKDAMLRELRQHQEALEESETRYRMLVHHAPAGIYEIDFRTGRFTEVNDVMCLILGYGREELLSLKALDIMDKEGRLLFLSRMKRGQSGEQLDDAVEYKVRTKDGRTIWALVNASFHREKGRIVSATVVATDITERKASEQELAMVREHMAQQEKMASLGRLAGGVAHELRNPLGAVKAALYLIDMDKERYNASVREAIDIINSEVTRSENIISSLLSLTRPIRSARKAVNVNAVLNDVLMITETGTVEVISDLDDTIPSVQSDPSELGILFGNIVTNAIQAMEGGGRLSVSSSSPEAGWIAVSIKDTGTGIPAENLNKIFEPLFTTKDTGIGIGLPLAKSIVDSNGGTIDVESELGKGSTFTIRLPIDLGGNVQGNGHLNAKGAIPRIVARSSPADRPPTKRKRVSGTK